MSWAIPMNTGWRWGNSSSHDLNSGTSARGRGCTSRFRRFEEAASTVQVGGTPSRSKLSGVRLRSSLARNPVAAASR